MAIQCEGKMSLEKFVGNMKRAAGALVIGGVSILNSGCFALVSNSETYDPNRMDGTIEKDVLGNQPTGKRLVAKGDIDERYIGIVVELDDRNIYDFIAEGNRVVLFYHPANGGQSINFDKAASEVDSANFGRANIYFYKGLISKFQTGDIPSIIMYQDGKEINRLVPSFFDVINGSVYGSYKEIRNKVRKTFP